jgi:biopolymer transport protein ExbB/biopolymer transport protein TolQ
MGLFARLVVIVMAIMSVASLVILAERLLVFMKSKRDSMAFAAKLAPVLGSGDLDAAVAAQPGKDIGHLGRTLMAGLSAYKASAAEDAEFCFESVARALERQAAREVANLKRGQAVLGTVASTAPFVGLLGTVMGIVTAFQLMAASGSGGLGTVSAGIAEALVTTAFGLLVAIPAVMAFNYLTSWVDSSALDMSESSNELLDIVARKLKVEGHSRGVQVSSRGGRGGIVEMAKAAGG